MKNIYVVHITKHNLRHMPEFTHSVGDLGQVKNDLLGVANTETFDDIHQVLAAAAKANKDKDYQIVHSYPWSD